MFTWLGRLATRRPWRIIGVWLVVLVGLVAFAPGVQVNSDQSSFLPDKYGSVQADRLADEAFPEQAGASAVVVFSRDDGGRLTSADRDRVGDVTTMLDRADLAGVEAIATDARQGVSPDGRVQVAQADLSGSIGSDEVEGSVKELRKLLASASNEGELRAGVTGEAAVSVDQAKANHEAELILAIATIVLILVLLTLVFRAVGAVLLPLAAVALVFGVTAGAVGLLSEALDFEVDASANALLIVVLFGAGTDYVLFLLFRYRESLREGLRSDEAVVTSVGRVGEAVASSGLVVVAAFVALLLSELTNNRGLAPSLIVSLLVMLLAAVTLVPAALSILGARVFWPSTSYRRIPAPGISERVAEVVTRRPGRVAAGSGALLLALAVGAFALTPDYQTDAKPPNGKQSKTALATFESAFPAGATNPSSVYVVGSVSDAELDRARTKLAAVDGVAAVQPAIRSTDAQVARIDVALERPPVSTAALATFEDDLRPAAESLGVGDRVVVGGQTATFADLKAANERDLGVVYPAAALAIFLILCLLLRAVVAPLYLIAAVGLGYVATLGATTLVFETLGGQDGVSASLPLLTYLFVVALGTDYNILTTARLREEREDSGSTRIASYDAIRLSVPTVAAAGIILAGTFATLMLTGQTLFVQTGFAITIGILISAFVMAVGLVPAVAALLGDRAWWPGRLRERRSAPSERDASVPPGPEPVEVG